MNVIDRSIQQASNNFEAVEFRAKTLADLDLPPLMRVQAYDGTTTVYQVHGDSNEAHTLVFTSTPFSAKLEQDLSQQVRLSGIQTALGPEYCVVGTQLYHPENQKTTGAQNLLITDGKFLPFAARFMAVIDELSPREDQKIAFSGYSKSADDMTEIAYQMITNPNYGDYQVNSLGVFDPARCEDRGRLAVLKAFATSGPDLFDNVVLSGSSALLEARGIDLANPKAKSRHMSEVNKHVALYTRADVPGVYAQLSGFAHDTTREQITELSQRPDAPRILAVRMKEADVCTGGFVVAMRGLEGVEVYEYPADHSAGDTLQTIGGLTMAAAA